MATPPRNTYPVELRVTPSYTITLPVPKNTRVIIIEVSDDTTFIKVPLVDDQTKKFSRT